MVAQDVILSDFELQVEDVEVFSFDATNVPLAEDARTHEPVDIF